MSDVTSSDTHWSIPVWTLDSTETVDPQVPPVLRVRTYTVPSSLALNVPRSHDATTCPFASNAIPGCHAFSLLP